MSTDLTEALAAGRRGLADRLKWPSMHWGVEDVHPDAWPHVVAAAVAAAAPLIEAQVRAQVAAEIEAAGHEPWCCAFAPSDDPCPCGLDDHARIARGESS